MRGPRDSEDDASREGAICLTGVVRFALRNCNHRATIQRPHPAVCRPFALQTAGWPAGYGQGKYRRRGHWPFPTPETEARSKLRNMRTRPIAVAGITGLALSILISTPSFASGNEASPEDDARTTFEALAPEEVLSSVAPSTLHASTSTDAVATVADDTVSISSAVGAVTMTASEDSPYTTVVPVLMDEASALFAVVIDGPEAPEQYKFDFDVPHGAEATILEDGSIAFLTPDGSFVAGVATPWARDSNEREIPTWFTLDGNSVVQHVDLSDVPDTAFPVVADPWLGQQLVSSAWVTNQGGSAYVVNSVPTSWGRQYIDIMTHSAHVAELKQKLGGNASKVTATIDNQFICHVVNNGFGGGATYNMESWRPNIHWTLQSNPITKCNP